MMVEKINLKNFNPEAFADSERERMKTVAKPKTTLGKAKPSKVVKKTVSTKAETPKAPASGKNLKLHFIKIPTDIRDNVMFDELAEALDAPRVTAVGIYVSLWALAAVLPGGFTRLSARQISRKLEWEESPEDLLSALLAAGVLFREDGKLMLSGWQENATDIENKRHKAKARMAEWRKRKKG